MRWPDDVRVQILDGLGEQLGRISAAAARTMLVSDQKNLVHADMEGVGLEGVAEIIDEGEND